MSACQTVRSARPFQTGASSTNSRKNANTANDTGITNDKMTPTTPAMLDVTIVIVNPMIQMHARMAPIGAKTIAAKIGSPTNACSVMRHRT